MIVFLTEEKSMTPVLRKVMQVLNPGLVEGSDWIIIAHNGKPDLLKNFTQKMRDWNYGDPHFLILQDNDGGNCLQSKERLVELASKTGKPYNVRIVCQEMEAWLIGDLNAVERAFPSSRATKKSEQALFRNPDEIAKPSSKITELTGTVAKVGRAEKISKFLNVDINISPSFQLLVSTVKELCQN